MATSMMRPRGGALFVAVGISGIVAVFITVMFQTVMTENVGTDSLVLDAQARYLAESGAEFAINRLKQSIANNLPLPVGGDKEVFSGYIKGYEPPAAGEDRKPIVEYKAIRIEASPTRTFSSGGVTGRLQLYAVTGRGWVPDPSSGRYAEVYINKMVDISLVPLFQYLAFYNRFSLEILPGNTATLKGRIHSNENIFIGVQGGKTLTINTEAMTSTGSIERHRKDKDSSASDYFMPGTVQIKQKGVPDKAPVNSKNYPIMEASGTLKTPGGKTVPPSIAPSGFDSNFNGYDGNGDGNMNHPTQDLKSFKEGAQDRWNGSVQTGASGVTPMEAPTDLTPFREADPKLEKGTHKYNPSTKTWEPASDGTHVPNHYHQNANLVIFSNGDKTQLLDNNGTVLFESTPSGITTNLLKDKSGKPIVPLTEKKMFDGREYDPATDSASKGMVNITELDMGKLNQAYRSDNNAQVFPDSTVNGVGSIMYSYRTDSTTQDPNGFRITNGSELNNKLTFVSENPVYIKGDFNVTAKGDKGTIIMADSVNLLSNEWDDSKKSSSSLAQPKTNLEINAAMMTGAYDTISPGAGSTGKYNGGFENFPRFHEDWSGSGKSVNILGSFVSLFESKYGRGPWVYGANKYTAPVRNWNFNEKFLDPSYTPPGFPVSVGHARVVWWKGKPVQWWP